MKKLNKKLLVFLVILLGVALIALWQFDNIKSLYYWAKYDNESIDGFIQEQKENVDAYLKEHGEYNVRRSTELEEKLHSEEIISDDEFVGILTGDESVERMFGTELKLDDNKNFVDESGTKITKDELTKAKEENLSDTKVTEKNPHERASECIARMYVLKSGFETKLSNLFYEARAYYYNMSPERKKNAKAELIKVFFPRITALESECDSQVDAVLKELDTLITQTGQDKSVIEQIRQAYKEEKNLKKAYYMNRLT